MTSRAFHSPWVTKAAAPAQRRPRSLWAPAQCAAALLLACLAAGPALQAHAAPPAPAARAALVTQDKVALRAAPGEAAPVQTLLWRGEALEVRAARGDYVQVWDHHRERGGYVRATQLMAVSAEAAEAPRLLALLDHVSEQPGAESLGLALAAASIQALPPVALQGSEGASVLDAIGRQAERLAQRASAGRGGDAALTAHLDIAQRHGVHMRSREQGERMRLCYDGDVDRRLLALPAASAAQKARAALALTRTECLDAPARLAEREAQDMALITLLSHADGPALPAHWHARLATRQAELWSRLAFTRAQRGDAEPARQAAHEAIQAIGRVDKAQLLDEDLARFHAAAMRVNAVRWAAVPAPNTPVAAAANGARLVLRTHRADDGQQCVALHDTRAGAMASALTERCTWGQLWLASAAPNRQGTALTLAVQPVDGWRELWVFSQEASGWTVRVLPPAALQPGVGYAEFAGWEPAGRRLLVAREAVAEGRTLRRFEVVALSTLVAERTAFEADALGPFTRWADPAWRRDSLALR